MRSVSDGWRQALANLAVLTVTHSPAARWTQCEDALAANPSFLIRRGIRLLVAGGNSGEFAMLTPAEQLEVTRIDAGAGRLLIHQPPVRHATDP